MATGEDGEGGGGVSADYEHLTLLTQSECPECEQIIAEMQVACLDYELAEIATVADVMDDVGPALFADLMYRTSGALVTPVLVVWTDVEEMEGSVVVWADGIREWMHREMGDGRAADH